MDSRSQGNLNLAVLATQYATKILSQERISPSDLKMVIDTLRSTPWSRPIVTQIGSRIINKIFQRLRDNKIPQCEYTALVQLICDPIKADTLTPPFWGLWDELILKYNLEKSLPHAELKTAIMKMSQGSIKTPLDLADLTKKQALVLDTSLFTSGTLALLWQCAKCQLEYPRERTTKRFHKDPKALTNMLQKIKGKGIENTTTFKEFNELAEALDLPKNFDQLSPGAKVKLLGASHIDRTQMTRYLTLGAEINLLRTVKSSLPSVRSGARSYFRFCDLMARPSFPPTEDTVQLWSATFRTGKTYNQYLAHLQKACLLLHSPLGWLTPLIRNLAKGLKNAQDLSFKFPNFIESAALITLIRFVKLDSKNGQLYYLAYLFALRVPSEALRLVRAFKDDRITEFIPQTDKALIGTRTFKGTTVLVIKFAFRKNIRNGCILMRPCLCQEESRVANDLCPVHRIWPCIRDQVQAGEPLFPSLTANTVNRQLKATMTALGFDQGGLYSSHAFRRGATQEVKNSGSTLATILKTGTWLSACYKNYLDLKADEAINISTLLLDNLGSDSEDSDHDPMTKRDKRRKNITKKVRKLPLSFRNDTLEMEDELDQSTDQST